MAADRAKTTLMISLIIFVMITFVLAVTTYLGFQQKVKEEETAKSARSEMEKANRDRDAALEQTRRIREVLGFDKETADDIEAERTTLFDRKFAGFNKDPKTLLRLSEWLDDAIKSKDEVIKQLEADKVQIRQENEAAVVKARQAQAAAEKEQLAAENELKKVTEDFKTRWAQHEQQQGQMKTDQEQALDKSKALQALVEEVVKLGPLLSRDLREKFDSQRNPPTAPERVRLVFRQLIDNQKTIQQLNATLAQLRVADPDLQALVRDKTPEDDRIDGFDGRISSVNAVDRSALLVCDSTAGMRPGLVLAVYDPDDPRPRSGSRKGVVEVIEVEGPTLARARIRRESVTAPIVPGDGVATSLWAPGERREIVIVGYVRFGADRKQDEAALKTLVERSGARVVDAVTPLTAIVVDAGLPGVDDQSALESDSEWKSAPKRTPAGENRRNRMLKAAKEAAIRVVSLDGLLDMLGLDRESLDGRRLPHELGAAP